MWQDECKDCETNTCIDKDSKCRICMTYKLDAMERKNNTNLERIKCYQKEGEFLSDENNKLVAKIAELKLNIVTFQSQLEHRRL
ncbi:unnamed protein product [marine sediment metagenome]|uniref:Uncharacterized protein n=1 Tax=marine sediment metagenome TaxID=412755 RepID=X0TU30_9ZZZZ